MPGGMLQHSDLLYSPPGLGLILLSAFRRVPRDLFDFLALQLTVGKSRQSEGVRRGV